MDPELHRLFSRRARAKYRVNLDKEDITPQILADSAKAEGLTSRINYSIKDIESHLEEFKLAHREYVRKILEDDSRDEEEMNRTIDGYNEYLKNMAEQVHDVLALHFILKGKL